MSDWLQEEAAKARAGLRRLRPRVDLVEYRPRNPTSTGGRRRSSAGRVRSATCTCATWAANEPATEGVYDFVVEAVLSTGDPLSFPNGAGWGTFTVTPAPPGA